MYTENSAVHLSKVLTFFRDSTFELEATYATPERVPDNDSSIAKFLVRNEPTSIDIDSNVI